MATLDIGAYAFMRLYERSGRLQIPGLVLADNPRAERLLSGVRELQRRAVHEEINLELISVGLRALERAQAGEPLTRVDELLRDLSSDDEAATDAVVAQGFAVDRVSNAEATENLLVRVELHDGRLVMTRLTASGGAPRDPDDIRARAAGILLWAHITGTPDPGPLEITDPTQALAQLKEQGVSVKRAFRGELIRSRGA